MKACSQLRSAAVVIYALLQCSYVNASVKKSLLDPVYTRLPTGTVKPHGWAMNMAQVQAHGLASQQPLWYSYVKDSVWQGGTIEYSEMQEAAPYWFNAWVPLAHQLQDETLLNYTKVFLDHIYASQEPSGYFGPYPFNASLPTLLWPRYLTMLGLIQYAEADMNERTRICDLIHSFVPYAADKFANDNIGDVTLGGQYGFQHVRWEELILVLQWLYDNDPRGKETELIHLMNTARTHGFSWKDDFFVDNSTFPRVAVPGTDAAMPNHGVNIAEALKSELLAWRFTGDQSDIDSTYARLEMLYKYHGRPQGIFSADEHLAGLNPSRGTEFCASVEAMFSYEMMYATLGDPVWADMAEKIAYNALPAQITHDWWAQQYLHQTNQIWVGNHTHGVPWTDDEYANVMGMEPSYPCCTVNHPQGWPKFWSNSFMLADNGTAIVHALLGPATLSTELRSGADVAITIKTLYPFSSKLSYTITTSAPFTFYIRIPSWATSKSHFSVNELQAGPVTVNSGNMLQYINIDAGTTKIELYLDMDIRIEQRVNGSIAVHRGPLLYAIDLAHNDTVTDAWRCPWTLEFIKKLPDVPLEDLTPSDSHTCDHTWLTTMPWNIAIDPTTLLFHEDTVDELPYYVWERGAQPQYMTVTACEIHWPTTLGDAELPPQGPNTCLGPTFTVILRPFGGTELRIGEIPIMSSMPLQVQ